MLKKAHEKEINISSFVDIELRRYMALIEGNVFDSGFSKKVECGRRDLNPSFKLGKRIFTGVKSDLNKYLVLRDLEGISSQWKYQCTQWLKEYLSFVDWKISETKTLQYFQQLKNTESLVYYKKKVYQIRKFLEYLKLDWAQSIKLPRDPEYLPKRISNHEIQNLLEQYKDNKQVKALILLGCASGLRALEIYSLRPGNINLENRTLSISHSKTGKPRVAFFNDEAKQALSEYLLDDISIPFSQGPLSKLFKNSTIKIKDFRKYFSQSWDRKGGPTSIKKILMGHSLKSDVDLMHYNAQSPEDLKAIYDRVMNTPTPQLT